MLTNTESKKPRVEKLVKGKPILLSKCVVCDSKKLRSAKNKEGCVLISSLVGVK